MKSATLELLKYFESEGIQCLGNPYISFVDVADGPLVCWVLPTGRMILLRISTGRWLVQWWRFGMAESHQSGGYEIPWMVLKTFAANILALLEEVLAYNRAALQTCKIADAR